MRFLILLILFSASLVAQDQREQPTVHVVAKYTPEGTVLRWGYGELTTWRDNYREGVVIHRRRVAPNPEGYREVHRTRLMADEELRDLAASTGNELLGALHAIAYQNWENSIYQGEGDDFAEKRDNLNNRYTFFHYVADRDRQAAEAAGLGWTDRDLEKGATYAYRVMSVGASTAMGYKVVAPNTNRARPLVQSVEEGEQSITLSWSRELHDRHFSGYHIERSPEGTEEWTRLTDAPYVQGYDKRVTSVAPAMISYKDVAENGRPMRYRVIGLDAFGDESPPSPTVVAQARDRTPPEKPYLRADETEQLHLQKRLIWRQPEGEEVATYHLTRRFNNQSNVVIDFAGPGDTMKVDQLDEPGTYLYRLAAQDAAGNLAWSEEYTTIVKDRNRPPAPTGLEAETDTNGVVTLTWDASPSKTVVGYYVFAADGEGRAFTKLTGTGHPYRRYRDTVSLGLTNRFRYYRVMALDKDFQYSDYSDTLKVLRPDVIPPTPAHVSDFQVKPEGIHLNLRHSNSADAVRHQLLRKEKGEEELQVIMEWEYPPFNHVDTTVKAGRTYQYAYRGVDPSGNVGMIPSVVEVSTRVKSLPAPTLEAEAVEGRVRLTWSATEPAAAWQLYRRVGEGSERRLSTLAGDHLDYLDGRTRPGERIEYRLRLVRADGRRSPFSEPVTIILE